LFAGLGYLAFSSANFPSRVHCRVNDVAHVLARQHKGEDEEPTSIEMDFA
jgi:hypothetical protein